MISNRLIDIARESAVKSGVVFGVRRASDGALPDYFGEEGYAELSFYLDDKPELWFGAEQRIVAFPDGSVIDVTHLHHDAPLYLSRSPFAVAVPWQPPEVEWDPEQYREQPKKFRMRDFRYVEK